MDPSDLGGRLPLLRPADLNAEQKAFYDLVNGTMVPWAERSGFQSRTGDGALIGPFNPTLFSPAISSAFLQLQEAESKHTSLAERVRQVVILSVGAVWRAPYELYAHSAVARTAGMPEAAVRALVAGEVPDGLGNDETLAARFARSLTTAHRVDAALYEAGRQAFGPRGLVDLIYLAGCYHTVCSLLNAFEIPAPSGRFPTAWSQPEDSPQEKAASFPAE